MARKHRIALEWLVLASVVALILPGCGGSGSSPSGSAGGFQSGNATKDFTLEFVVNNQQYVTSSNPVKSFILGQVPSLASKTVHFQIRSIVYNEQPPSVQTHTPAFQSPDSNNPSVQYQVQSLNSNLLEDVTYDPAVPISDTLNPVINPGLWTKYPGGFFDAKRFTYTPPPQVVVDPNHTTLPLDYVALYISPDDPAFKPVTLLIHLNLSMSISPTSLTINANTSDAPTQYTQQFTASIPGDGFKTGQVNWYLSSTVPQSAGPPSQVPATGSIDSTGNFIAPQQQGTFYVEAQSVTQPDKFAYSVVTVQQGTTTIGFQ